MKIRLDNKMAQSAEFIRGVPQVNAYINKILEEWNKDNKNGVT
jgi:hypothetical protein